MLSTFSSSSSWSSWRTDQRRRMLSCKHWTTCLWTSENLKSAQPGSWQVTSSDSISWVVSWWSGSYWSGMQKESGLVAWLLNSPSEVEYSWKNNVCLHPCILCHCHLQPCPHAQVPWFICAGDPLQRSSAFLHSWGAAEDSQGPDDQDDNTDPHVLVHPVQPPEDPSHQVQVPQLYFHLNQANSCYLWPDTIC